MKKDNKFQHKFDPELAKCQATGMWCLTYVDGKGMFCNLCRISSILQQSNESKIWNSEPNVRCRTETIKIHFSSSGKTKRTMHMDAVFTENAKRGTYFIQKEKEVEAVISTTNEKVFQSLYWFCKNEVAHRKLNSLLELVESLGVEEVVHFSKRSSTVRKLLILIDDQVKEDLLGKIKKSPFFGLLTDEVTDITNIQNLVTFI